MEHVELVDLVEHQVLVELQVQVELVDLVELQEHQDLVELLE